MPNMPHETNRPRRRNNTTQTTPQNNPHTRTPSSTQINNIQTALNTILNLENKWPTDHDITNTRQPNLTPTRTHTHGPTDFGTTRHTLTKTWLTNHIHQLRVTWQHQTSHAKTTPPTTPNYRNDTTWIRDNTPRLYTYPAYHHDLHQLTRLAHEAAKTCAQTAEPTGHTCPECGTQLERPYTTQGLLDIETCPGCGQHWTPQTLTQQAHAHAQHTHIPDNYTCTQTQAAKLLGVKLSTINQRIRDRHIQPVNKKRRLYNLNQLK